VSVIFVRDYGELLIEDDPTRDRDGHERSTRVRNCNYPTQMGDSCIQAWTWLRVLPPQFAVSSTVYAVTTRLHPLANNLDTVVILFSLFQGPIEKIDHPAAGCLIDSRILIVAV
jgi:hypothetical protein